MEVLDTFAAENRWMLTAIEVLYALLMLLAHIRREISLVCLIIVVRIRISLQAFLEVNTREKWIAGYHLVKDVEVKW